MAAQGQATARSSSGISGTLMEPNLRRAYWLQAGQGHVRLHHIAGA